MSTPSNLRPPADDVGKHIRCWPWFGMVEYRLYFIASGIINAKTLLQENLVDVGLEILGAFRVVRGHMVSQLVGKMLAGMRSVRKDARVPKILRICFVELCIASE